MPRFSLRRVWSPDWVPILLGQGVGVLCGLAGIRLLSTWVPPDVLGLYGLCLILAPAGGLLTHHGLARHAARHWPLEGNPREYYDTWLAAARRTSLLLLGLLLLALAGLSATNDIPFGRTLPWLCIAALTGAYGALLHAVLQTSRAYWSDCAASCANSVARTGGPLLALWIAGVTVPVLLAGFAVPQALVLLAAWWWLLGRRLPPTQPRSPAKPGIDPPDVSTYARAFWWIGACTLVGAGLHRAGAAVCLDAVELGYFTLAGNLAFVIPNVLSAALSQFLYPRLFAHARRDEAAPPSTWLRPVAITAVIFSVIAWGSTLALHALAPRLMGPLIDPDYAGALPYLIANGGYATALALGHFAQLPAIAAGRPHAARRAMIGLVVLLAAGSGVTALVSPDAYVLWLTLSPLAAGAWLAVAAWLDTRA